MSLRLKLCLSAWVIVVAGSVLNQHASGADSDLVPMPVPLAPRTTMVQQSDKALTPVPENAPAAVPDIPAPDASPNPAIEDAPLPPGYPAPQTFQSQPEQVPHRGYPTLPQLGYSVPPVDGQDWHIEIRPAAKIVVQRNYPSTVATSGTDSEGCHDCGRAQVDPERYMRIYSSIPFNRAEYNVNPSYRHDSAMEILTGNARHNTIVRHDAASSRPVERRPNASYSIRNPIWNPAMYGYLRPALRLNYYRYFPSLNPYMNIWNLSGAF